MAYQGNGGTGGCDRDDSQKINAMYDIGGSQSFSILMTIIPSGFTVLDRVTILSKSRLIALNGCGIDGNILCTHAQLVCGVLPVLQSGADLSELV